MPDTPSSTRFDTRQELETQFRACLDASSHTLDLFDPDFSLFPLGRSDIDTALRAFLARGGAMRLAMHSSAWIERHYPRFLRLLRDYGHRIECRMTGSSLRQLTDSFVIGDGEHIVRRYHSDHFRGEAIFCETVSTETARERFMAIWEESRPTLHPGAVGL